jgi:hypothetical protein
MHYLLVSLLWIICRVWYCCWYPWYPNNISWSISDYYLDYMVIIGHHMSSQLVCRLSRLSNCLLPSFFAAPLIKSPWMSTGLLLRNRWNRLWGVRWCWWGRLLADGEQDILWPTKTWNIGKSEQQLGDKAKLNKLDSLSHPWSIRKKRKNTSHTGSSTSSIPAAPAFSPQSLRFETSDGWGNHQGIAMALTLMKWNSSCWLYKFYKS